MSRSINWNNAQIKGDPRRIFDVVAKLEDGGAIISFRKEYGVTDWIRFDAEGNWKGASEGGSRGSSLEIENVPFKANLELSGEELALIMILVGNSSGGNFGDQLYRRLNEYLDDEFFQTRSNAVRNTVSRLDPTSQRASVKVDVNHDAFDALVTALRNAD